LIRRPSPSVYGAIKKMKSGMMYKQGEVVIVPFPFSDLSGTKRRPVLILSTEDYNSKTEDIIICGVTSNLKNSDYSVLFDNDNLVQGNIPARSRIKVDKLFTIEKSKVVKKVAVVSDEVLNNVKNEMIKLFSF